MPRAVNGLKVCSRKDCEKRGEWQTVSCFNRQKGSSDGRHTWCKSCRSRVDRNYYLKDSTKKLYSQLQGLNGQAFIWTLKRKYCLDWKQYWVLYKLYHGRCHACKRLPERVLNIDHCHSSNQVRGLLCSRCNILAGSLESSVRPLVESYLQEVV